MDRQLQTAAQRCRRHAGRCLQGRGTGRQFHGPIEARRSRPVFADAGGRLASAVADRAAVPAHHAVPGSDDALLGGRMTALLATRRSEEHTSELQSLMRITYAVFCYKKK